MSFSAVVLTVSDSAARGARVDESGEVAEQLLGSIDIAPVERGLVPDDFDAVAERLRDYVRHGLALVITTGGTGLGPRDLTPEATKQVIERDAPGLAELMRSAGAKHTALASLSRGVAGAAGKTLIVNLPGSPKAVEESLGALLEVLPHALSLLRGDDPHP